MGVKLGEEVGYTVRFDDCSRASTRVRFLTDGCLLREAIQDPLLTRYGSIIIDEAHERSVSTDILLAIAKKAAIQRREAATPLRVVVASATLEVKRFREYFGGCPWLQVPGRLHPVSVCVVSATKKTSQT